jgi:hypothetical protein
MVALVDYNWQRHGFSGLVTRGFFRHTRAQHILKGSTDLKGNPWLVGYLVHDVFGKPFTLGRDSKEP